MLGNHIARSYSGSIPEVLKSLETDLKQICLVSFLLVWQSTLTNIYRGRKGLFDLTIASCSPKFCGSQSRTQLVCHTILTARGRHSWIHTTNFLARLVISSLIQCRKLCRGNWAIHNPNKGLCLPELINNRDKPLTCPQANLTQTFIWLRLATQVILSSSKLIVKMCHLSVLRLLGAKVVNYHAVFILHVSSFQHHLVHLQYFFSSMNELKDFVF